MMFIKNYILRLKERMRYHEYLYHSLGSPIISDCRYDFLIEKLNYLKKKYKHLFAEEDFFVSSVGAPGIAGLKRYKHITPMLSLNHVFDTNSYLNFDRKIKRFLKEIRIAFCCELKIDGLALNLIYKKGILIRAMTRGDGIIGEDVTNNVRMISSIPNKLHGINVPRKLEVRGEIFMLKSNLMRLNSEAINNHTKIFSNTRNASSGLLRQKCSKTTIINNLTFCCYGYGYYPRYTNIFSHYHRLLQLHRWGLPISGYNSIFYSYSDVLHFFEKIKNVRQFLDFDIDGIVVKVDSVILQSKLGYMNTAPRWAIAIKFIDQEKISKILNVIYQVGRTGVITPVAIIDPVRISGVTIGKVSLYNFGEIKRLGVRIGDFIKVKRSGDVIPKIISVIGNCCSDDVSQIEFPRLCPVCKSVLKVDDEFVKVRCMQGLKCSGQLKRMLYYFCSKDGLNICGLGFKIISKLVDKNYIKNFSDFFSLTYKLLISLDDIGKKTAINIISAINRSRDITFSKFLCSLGICEVGFVKSKIIAQHFRSLDNLMNSTLQELCLLKGIGLSTAHHLFNFINKKVNREIIFSLSKNLNISLSYIRSDEIVRRSNLFFKKKVVISGSFNKFSRTKVIYWINKLEGRVMSNVSKNTDYIILGKNPGHKFVKSKEFNLKVILEQELLDTIKKFFEL
ncbi:MAG: NAD-dependent DNA ligase LigA [Buchnera aphidicola (Meitanaphis elongallis)]